MAEEVHAPTPTSTADAPVTALEAGNALNVVPDVTASTDSGPPKPQPAAVPIPPTPAEAKPTPAANENSPAPTPTTKSDEEPQNALTRKFTEAEWKAVKELRATLPTIFAEAYPEKSDAKTTPVTLWGITIDPLKFDDARVSVILVKFLRARYLNVREAQTMLIATLRWRDEFKPHDAVKEEFPADVFGKLGHVYGHDNGGRPVTYNLYGANQDLKAVFGDVPRFLRWRVALMEKGVAAIDFENVDQMVQIHDYEGVTLSSRDANSKNAAAEATSIFSAHYPEFLYKKFFVNVPTIMTWIFWAFKPLLSAQTLAKMSVVGSGHHAIGKALLPIIEAEQLPRRYGGKAEAF